MFGPVGKRGRDGREEWIGDFHGEADVSVYRISGPSDAADATGWDGSTYTVETIRRVAAASSSSSPSCSSE